MESQKFREHGSVGKYSVISHLNNRKSLVEGKTYRYNLVHYLQIVPNFCPPHNLCLLENTNVKYSCISFD